MVGFFDGPPLSTGLHGIANPRVRVVEGQVLECSYV